jgi:hypothetical protein
MSSISLYCSLGGTCHRPWTHLILSLCCEAGVTCEHLLTCSLPGAGPGTGASEPLPYHGRDGDGDGDGDWNGDRDGSLAGQQLRGLVSHGGGSKRLEIRSRAWEAGTSA